MDKFTKERIEFLLAQALRCARILWIAANDRETIAAGIYQGLEGRDFLRERRHQLQENVQRIKALRIAATTPGKVRCDCTPDCTLTFDADVQWKEREG